MLKILDNNKESYFNNTNFFKSPLLSFYNLYSPRKFRSTQTAQATTLDIDTNECLPI